MARTRFKLVLIKPSHYDDDGYPIRWLRTLIPSNSLAAVYGLARECREQRVLGSDVDLEITLIDDTCQRIRAHEIVEEVQTSGDPAFVCLVGVQTNQFPRALDIADRFIAAGLPVCVGGFHVSGHLAMFGELPAEARAAQARGVSFFAGEAEGGRFGRVLRDAYRGELEPLYDYLGDLPDLGGEPTPYLPLESVSRTGGHYSAFDLGRGCPFDCSFCTIINVHGHRSRFRTPDDLERIVRENHASGVNRFFLTDDNLSRNRNWEAFFDRLIALRGEGIKVRILAQVDVRSHRVRGFIDKACRAGVDQLFIGIESVNEANLAAVGKRHNKVDDYREMLLAWKRHPVVITAGYIIGLPEDTPESVARDIERIKAELPLDHVYFTNLTPLPGSADHKALIDRGEWMSDDLNEYDTHHCVTRHPRMSAAEWRAANRDAWRRFYTRDHMETVLRRMLALRSDKKYTTIHRLVLYSHYGRTSTIHPIDGGMLRMPCRRDRRPTLPRERRRDFYPRYLKGLVGDAYGMLGTYLRLRRFVKRQLAEPRRREYTDRALEP